MNDATPLGATIEPSLDALELETFLPYRLSLLAHLVSHGISSAYEARHGISPAQWRVMAAVAEQPGITAQRVVSRTPMDKVKVSRAVAGLSEQGLLRRSASPRDGRASLLTLTAAGKRVYEDIRPRAEAYAERLLEVLSPAERESLQDMLGRLVVAARGLGERG